MPYAAIAGPDGKFGTADDVNPGYPFWIAGVACGVNDPTCEESIVGQRPSTPPLDMATRAEAQALVDPVTGVEPFTFQIVDPTTADAKVAPTERVETFERAWSSARCTTGRR